MKAKILSLFLASFGLCFGQAAVPYIGPIIVGNQGGGGGGGGGTPGGLSGDWQYNNAGSFGGYTPAAGWVDLFTTPTSAFFGSWITDGTGFPGLVVGSQTPTIDAPNLTGTTTVATANVTTVNVTTLQPATNDGAALGSTSRQFSDLFLAEGGVINWDAGDATITQAGNVVTVAGAALENSSPGTAANSVMTVDGTQTVTNKTFTPRILTITSSGTPTINTDSYDCVTITAQAAAITSMTSSRTGTINNFQQLEIRIKDDGTARAITWGADYASGIATLPTTTILGKTLVVYLEGDTVTGDFMCMATGSYP